MATPPTEATTAISTVRVVLFVFATPDKGAGAEVSSAGSADFILVIVGMTVLMLAAAGAPVKLRASEVWEAGAELDEELDDEEEELEELAEVEEEDADVKESEVALVDEADELDEAAGVTDSEADVEEAAFGGSRTGIAPAPATA